jgi:hypothetical protein
MRTNPYDNERRKDKKSDSDEILVEEFEDILDD